jgi:succinate-acetate transporter protein
MFRPGRDKGIATPVPLGLAAFAVTTFLMGVSLIFQSSAAWSPYYTNALMMGGLAELVAGMWAFAYGDPLAATVFTFLGGFYGWWGINGLMLHGAALNPISMGVVFAVTGCVVAYLWVASFYETAVFNLALLFVWVSYILMGISIFVSSFPLAVIGGIAAIVSALIAAYGSFAELYNAAGFKDVVPVGEPMSMRERSVLEENERLRRIHIPSNHQEAEGHA